MKPLWKPRCAPDTSPLPRWTFSARSRPTILALLSAPNLLATPHLGASTKEGQEAVGIQIAKQVRDYLLQGIAQNAVNLPSLSDVEYKQIKPVHGVGRQTGPLCRAVVRLQPGGDRRAVRGRDRANGRRS